MRRKIHYVRLGDSVAECQRLAESGYQQNGNWSLGQICNHLRVTIDASIDGYPKWMSLAKPLRPILRWMFLSKLLNGASPSGVRTAKVFLPEEAESDQLDQLEVAAFAKCVNRFLDHEGRLHPHPGFGHFSKSDLEHFHAAHAAHHLSFLSDK